MGEGNGKFSIIDFLIFVINQYVPSSFLQSYGGEWGWVLSLYCTTGNFCILFISCKFQRVTRHKNKPFMNVFDVIEL